MDLSRLTTALLTALLAARTTPAWANLDVAFVLDTTGSMSGEIREAKERIQQIAQALTKDRGQERIRFGVVAYRDRGDQYLTKVSPFSPEVDDTFGFLAALTADGGGDSPEDVLSGIKVALGDLDWDLAEGTERQIFLIGDAPAHLDYPDGVKPAELIRKASEKRIVINTIGCRSLPQDGIGFFRELAYATEGSYQHIGRVGGPGSGTLAGALLKALVTTGDERVEDGVPIALLPPSVVHQQAGSVGVHAEISGCALRVSLPPGVRLASAPKLLRTEKKVVADLSLGASGEGASEATFPLSACLPKVTPIQVRIDG